LFYVIPEIGVDVEHPKPKAAPHIFRVQITTPYKQANGLEEIKNLLCLGRIGGSPQPLLRNCPAVMCHRLTLEFLNKFDEMFHLFRFSACFNCL